jgi:NAD(P)-dependent dehydrogenase (short-subunit alcohol dehydrogenase family)
MSERLAGKIAVVTGAGSGIGRAAARAFVAEGAQVGLLDRNGPAVESEAAELGPAAFPLVCDVSQEDHVRAAFAEVSRRHGRLDVLYNCAGIELMGQDARAHELELAVWQQIMAVNLTGVFLCCKHALPLMLSRGKGSIINCGSPTALTGCGAGEEAYSSSKGGVMALTRVMAIDYARDGIRVNAVVPGTIDTPMNAPVLSDPKMRAELIAGEPIGRLGLPEDLAGIAVFLASDESSFATGATFVVDGGLIIR